MAVTLHIKQYFLSFMFSSCFMLFPTFLEKSSGGGGGGGGVNKNCGVSF